MGPFVEVRYERSFRQMLSRGGTWQANRLEGTQCFYRLLWPARRT